MQKIIAKINLKNLRENALAFKRSMKTALCAVVKANAYGHGATETASALYPVADFFAVALIEEAIEIAAAAGGKPVLIFTPPTSEETVLFAAVYGFVLTVADMPSARLVKTTAEKYGVEVRVHLKVNTGMNRYGVYGSWLGRVCAYIVNCPRVRVEGVYSHLYTHDKRRAEEQRQRFVAALSITKRYFPYAIAHLSATYGATLGEEFSFDAVRIGLGLYGYFAGEETPFALKPVMSVYAESLGTRKYLFGGLGYGDELQADGKEHSVLRVGYADGAGHDRRGGNAFQVQNDFCMDACMVKGKIARGKKAELFSSAERIASDRETIVYEVLCLYGARAERRYEEN